MNNNLRHYIVMFKESEAIKNKLERSYTPDLQSDYEEVCNMRNLMFVELMQAGYPFISLPDEDVVRMNIDEKNYDISRAYLRSFIGEDECNRLLSQTTFKEREISDEDDAAYTSEFNKLKNKFASSVPSEEMDNLNAVTNTSSSNETPIAEPNNRAFRQTYENVEVNNEAPVIDYFIKEGRAKRINTTEFAFMGLQHGAGTTHTAIMFAQALATEENCDVAYFEANKSNHMSDLIHWHTGQNAENGFPLNGVDFYYGMSYIDFVARYKDMYDYVIVDFGTYNKDADISDFIRIPIKFVVSSGIDWNLPKLSDFYNTFEYDKIHGITYIIPFFENTNESLGYIKNITSQNRLIGVPFNLNPFEPSEEITESLKTLVGFSSADTKEESTKEKPTFASLFKKIKGGH